MTKLLPVRQNNVMFLTDGNIHALGINCLELNNECYPNKSDSNGQIIAIFLNLQTTKLEHYD